jgi:type IV secretion system protein VirD4
MPESMTPLVAVGVIGALFILLLSLLTNNYSLNNIKSKTVGDGQYGTARWATDQEIRKAYVTVPFDVAAWRAGKKRPTVQGLVLGSVQRGKRLDALVDRDDVHCLMIGASGVGKTAFFLYPNIEFACACGMSFLILDTKGDLARNCGRIAQKYYGYRVSVVDLRNPIRSDGNNLMTLVNRYMDVAVSIRTTLQHGRMQKNMQRSSPKPSSIRAATSRIADRIRTSMTQQRACWQP